jgi:hypothetical protein
LSKGDPVGLYTGVAAPRDLYQNTDYMWTYGTFIPNIKGFEAKHFSAGTDSRRAGNYMVRTIYNDSVLLTTMKRNSTLELNMSHTRFYLNDNLEPMVCHVCSYQGY